MRNKVATTIRRLLAARGVHFFVTRFGPKSLRRLAFDEKYNNGDWSFTSDGGELPAVVGHFLQNGDLLIMGCGGSSVLGDLAKTGLNSAVGVDLSPKAIEIASRFASDKISFQVADMLTYKCQQPYDVILFSESLNYIPIHSQLSFLQRLAAFLKKDGVFIVTLAQPRRYLGILLLIRNSFHVIEDRTLAGSSRHLIVFRLP